MRGFQEIAIKAILWYYFVQFKIKKNRHIKGVNYQRQQFSSK